MDAHRLRVALVRKNGMPLDYAREAAVEAGYLHPDADINDLLGAIDEELHGRKIYRLGEAGAAEMARLWETRAGRQEHYLDQARTQVLLAEDEHGIRLSPAEIDHAAELVLHGAHPDEALRSAARASEETALQRNAERAAFSGEAGVPPAANQSALPLSGSSGLTLKPNLPAEAVAKLKAANTAYREYKQTFRTGPVGEMLRPGAGGAPYRMSAARVAGNLAEPDKLRAYLAATGGGPEALAAVSDALVGDLRRRGVIEADGAIKSEALARWMSQRRHTLAQAPELAARLRNAGTAQETLDEMSAAHTARLRGFQRGVAQHFLGGDPEEAVRKALASRSAQSFRDLARAVSHDREATEGLKRAVVDYIEDRLTTSVAADEERNFLNSRSLRAFIALHKDGLRKLFGGQGMQNFEAVAADLRRITQRTSATAGSDTAANLAAAERHGTAPHGGGAHGGGGMSALGALIGEHVAGTHGLIGGAIIGKAGRYLTTAFKQAGIETTNDLVREALLYPDLARMLLQRIPIGETFGPAAQRRVAARVLASMATAQGGPRDGEQQ